MNNSEMPVIRLTRHSIWNSFQSLDKKHIIITGGRGSGKTTLARQFLLPEMKALISQKVGDSVFMSLLGRDESICVGCIEESAEGNQSMRPIEEAFQTTGIAWIRQLQMSDHPWVMIDEIGFLEQSCEAYLQAIRELLSTKQTLLVLRKQDLPFTRELLAREDVFVIDLDQPFKRAGLVIMASGIGRRFGGNKLLEPLGDKRLIEYMIDTTQGLFEKRVVVTRHEAVERLCRERGIACILHDLPGRDDTIRLGLDMMKEMDHVMFCPSDQPLIGRETIISNLLLMANQDQGICRSAYKGEIGAPVSFAREYYEELCKLPAGKGGNEVVRRHLPKVRCVQTSSGEELIDIDTREDLEHLKSYILK